MTTSSAKSIVGVDVGGANLKYATTDGVALSTMFPMWRHPNRLVDVLAEDLARLAPPFDALAVTMTGELADCFADRAAGVAHIVSHTSQAASRIGIDRVSFYGVDGRFRDAFDAAQDVDLVAAANWHALARFAASQIAGEATLIDIGSTTTDIIPISAGRVATTAKTDYERLLDGSLVYVGCRRTPVCALVDCLSYRGRVSNVMNEFFATIDDALLVLGIAEQDTTDCDTADGHPRTPGFAANRLARMIGLDQRTVDFSGAQELATQIVAAAKLRIHNALGTISPESVIVVSGHGQDLIDLPSENTVVRLAELLGPAVARCAPSFAVASLYRAEPLSVCD